MTFHGKAFLSLPQWRQATLCHLVCLSIVSDSVAFSESDKREVTDISETRRSRVSMGKRAKKGTTEEQRHDSGHKYVDIQADQCTKAMVMITD